MNPQNPEANQGAEAQNPPSATRLDESQLSEKSLRQLDAERKEVRGETREQLNALISDHIIKSLNSQKGLEIKGGDMLNYIRRLTIKGNRVEWLPAADKVPAGAVAYIKGKSIMVNYNGKDVEVGKVLEGFDTLSDGTQIKPELPVEAEQGPKTETPPPAEGNNPPEAEGQTPPTEGDNPPEAEGQTPPAEGNNPPEAEGQTPPVEGDNPSEAEGDNPPEQGDIPAEQRELGIDLRALTDAEKINLVNLYDKPEKSFQEFGKIYELLSILKGAQRTDAETFGASMVQLFRIELTELRGDKEATLESENLTGDQRGELESLWEIKFGDLTIDQRVRMNELLCLAKGYTPEKAQEFAGNSGSLRRKQAETIKDYKKIVDLVKASIS